MGKLGKKARKFAKKNLQSVMRNKRKIKALHKRKTKSGGHMVSTAEKADVLLSEEHSKEKFGDIARGAANLNFSFDDMYDKKDVDLIEDGSDSDGILSEDFECPYLSDSELEGNDKDNSECNNLSTSNKNIRLEIAAQKLKLDKLMKKDPEFSNFLESRKEELDKLKNEESDSDEEADTNYSNFISINEGTLLQNRTINHYSLDVWCWLALEQPKGPAFPILLNTFRTACRYGFDSDESHLHEIRDQKVFSEVLMFILDEGDGLFRKLLGVSESCGKDAVLKLFETSEWKLVRPLLKSYLRSCLHLLNQVTDGQILIFILSRLKYSVVLFSAFPRLTELLIKISINLWVTGEENLSLTSFLVIREIASKLQSNWHDSCLTKTYKAFIVNLKFFEPKNMKHCEMLMNSLVELYSSDLQRSYHHAHASLQQLASILCQAIKIKKKEELKKIHSWQYINCIILWVKFINCNLKDNDLQPLISLSILIIQGVADLFPGLRYLPLRLRCVQMLNQLSHSSGNFIPVVSLLFDCLDHKECTSESTDVKAFDFSSVLKAPKHLLKSRSFQEHCILSAIKIFSAHFSQWRCHISFPELATIPLILFKRFHKNIISETLLRQVKRFIDQVEQNKDLIERKRDAVSFSPNDHAAIDSFFQMEKNCSTSFNQYCSSVQQLI